MSRAHADAHSVQLSLTSEQGNLVITALAECPFKLVYELIGKLNRQANAASRSSDSYVCVVDAAELKLILDALSQLPYFQVHALVHELQAQLQQRLRGQVGISAPAKNSRKAGKR